ncbi:hypothetical protein CDAR_513921 [Caerostris darwini]|uniref:Uncharacterized protein n=1 Tax=Caerostris darwini TaxID=1538125 RepID=A0AAV4V864_9ARAC|nr:hypothetical protein CDAR_513921 [Caerostris darwini]
MGQRKSNILTQISIFPNLRKSHRAEKDEKSLREVGPRDLLRFLQGVIRRGTQLEWKNHEMVCHPFQSETFTSNVRSWVTRDDIRRLAKSIGSKLSTLRKILDML